MFGVAVAGLGVNLLMGYILHRAGHSHSHGGLPHGHQTGYANYVLKFVCLQRLSYAC